MMQSLRGRVGPISLFISILLFPGCAGEGAQGPPDHRVEGAWVRAMPLLGEASPAGTNSAAYMVIRNEGGTPDWLVAAETPQATGVELHESRVENGVMTMRRVEEAQIPAGSRIELKAGGLHLMLLGLKGPLVEGDTLTLTLRFRTSGPMDLRIPVLPSGGS